MNRIYLSLLFILAMVFAVGCPPTVDDDDDDTTPPVEPDDDDTGGDDDDAADSCDNAEDVSGIVNNGS